MRKTPAETTAALVAHAKSHPEHSYGQIAATFGLSVITVKRLCAELGRGKIGDGDADKRTPMPTNSGRP